jgi:hypothetical protein
MPGKLFDHIDLDIISVIGVFLLSLVIDLVSVKEGLGVIALLLSIGYTIWKWNRDHRKKKIKE